MAIVSGRNTANRPFFFQDVDGGRVEFPSFGLGGGELDGNELRMFQLHATAGQIRTDGVPLPDEFGDDDWSVAASEGGAEVTVTEIPSGNGLPLTGIAVRVDGEDVTIFPPNIGGYELELDPGEYSIDVAAISAAGQGTWSDPKSVEVE